MDAKPNSLLEAADRRTIIAVFDGTAIVRNRVEVPDFVRVLDGLQRSLFAVGQEMMGRQRVRGPIPQTYQDQLTLELLPTEPGSYKATLVLPEREPPPLIDISEDALDVVLAGIEAEVAGLQPVVSEPVRAIFRETIFKAIRPNSRLTLLGGKSRHVVTISEDTREQPQRVTTIVVGGHPSRLIGRLLEVDFKDRTAEVWDAASKMTKVRFTDNMADAIKSAARMQVVVDGEATVDDQGRMRAFEITDLVPIDLPDDFWRNPTLEDLVKEQGRSPIRSIGEFVVPSLQDEDADALIAELGSLRSV